MNATVAHRQTRYVAAPPLPEPSPLPMPRPTADVAQAQADLTEYGVCILTDVLTNAETTRLKERFERQAAAERAVAGGRRGCAAAALQLGEQGSPVP